LFTALPVGLKEIFKGIVSLLLWNLRLYGFLGIYKEANFFKGKEEVENEKRKDETTKKKQGYEGMERKKERSENEKRKERLAREKEDKIRKIKKRMKKKKSTESM
jgi:biopolymer transport protein ExbB/TolQ